MRKYLATTFQVSVQVTAAIEKYFLLKRRPIRKEVDRIYPSIVIHTFIIYAVHAENFKQISSGLKLLRELCFLLFTKNIVFHLSALCLTATHILRCCYISLDSATAALQNGTYNGLFTKQLHEKSGIL
jgi:hypothetical protein